MLTIRMATAADEPRIVDFIRENWKGNQTLVNSPEIFRYQYMTYTDCGFVIAEEDGQIIGIKGYVPMNRTENPDVAAALAIVVKNNHPMLNMEIQRFLEKQTNSRAMYSTGLNPNTAARIYPLFRYKVDKLKQYYMLSDKEDYKVASIAHKELLPAGGSDTLRLFRGLEEMQRCFHSEAFASQQPYKDDSYLLYRYFAHPIYHYDVYGVFPTGEDTARALVVGREIDVDGTCVLRIVDYIGDRSRIPHIGSALRRLLEEKNYEFLDFMCYGLPEEDLEAAGFSRRQEQDENIIPNYYEPFVRKNVDIVFFAKKIDGLLICKADGDQDRPNVYSV